MEYTQAVFRLATVRTKGKSLILDYRDHNGERHRPTIGKVGRDRELAVLTQQQYNQWLLEGKNPEDEMCRVQQAARLRAMTLGKFIQDEFLPRYSLRQKTSTQRRHQVHMRTLERYTDLWEAPLGKVTSELIERFQDARLHMDVRSTQACPGGKPLAPATVNRDIAFIKSVMERAVMWKYLDRNPLYRFVMLQEQNEREVQLTPEQVEALAQGLSSTMGEMVRFAAYSGLRRGNVLRLQIEELEFFDIPRKGVAGKVSLHVKGGRYKTFPLGVVATLILKRVIGRRTEGFVFINPRTGKPYNGISQTFFRTIRIMGLQAKQDGKAMPLTFHDLRRCFGTWLVEAGAPRETVKDLLGQRNVATTNRYTAVDVVKLGSVLSLLPVCSEAQLGTEPGGTNGLSHLTAAAI